jgi:HSP20 family protein
MPARDANRGRGGGRGQTGSRQGSGGRDADARQSAAGQGRGGGGTARAGQSQSGGGRSAASAQRGAGPGATQRGGASSASAERASGTSGGRASQPATSATQGAGGRPGAPVGARGATATGGAAGSDVNRRNIELGETGIGGGGGLTGGPPGQQAERERDIDTARERGAARAGSVGVGTRSGAGGSAQVRSGAPPEGAAVGGRAQGRGVSPWFTGSENPFTMMRRMQDDLDRVFHAFGIPRLGPALAPARELEELLARSPTLTQAAHWSPQIEVFERDDSLVVRADLPGVKRDDVEVNVEHDVLTIRGQRRQEYREAEGGYRRTERSYGTFFRQIPLPDGVDASQIEASYEDGVLEVVVPTPREQPAGRRRIDIR